MQGAFQKAISRNVHKYQFFFSIFDIHVYPCPSQSLDIVSLDSNYYEGDLLCAIALEINSN
jgi:hypothetical protein